MKNVYELRGAFKNRIRPSVVMARGRAKRGRRPSLQHNHVVIFNWSQGQWIEYPGLYEAYRAGMHTIRRGGAIIPSPFGESAEMTEDIGVLRAYARMLLASGALSAEEEMRIRDRVMEVMSRMKRKWNTDKLIAGSHLIRALEERDILGRENRPAAAMVTGAAIGHLLERSGQLGQIGVRVDARTLEIWLLIESYIELYQDCWRDLCKEGRLMKPLFSETSVPLRSLRPYMDAYIVAFQKIQYAPFSRNAYHAIRDLEEAIGAIDRNDRTALRDIYARLRNGLRWVFAQKALEMELRSPLGFLTEELRQKHTAEHRGKKRERFLPVRNMAPDRFDQILKVLDSYQERLERCTDLGLRKPVLAPVSIFISLARTQAEQDAWLDVAQSLKQAASLL